MCDDLIKFYENDVYYKHPGGTIGDDLFNYNGLGKKSTDVNVFPTCTDPAMIDRYKPF